jgi:2-polyprenyl-3-methyl-5-hydroxy-6-metoxy-1,4-benzoquinol methylase
MQELDFISANHTKTQRNYVQRVVEHDKAECAVKAKEWGYDYWDGDRRYGYGGMVYDGRWQPIAERIARHYGLAPGMKVLDVGCGKGFLLYELTQAVPGLDVAGLDISAYAIEHAKPEIADTLRVGNCTDPTTTSISSFPSTSSTTSTTTSWKVR